MTIAHPRMLLEPLADVSTLYEVYVVLVVAAGSDQDAQEVQVVAQVLDERRLHTARKNHNSCNH